MAFTASSSSFWRRPVMKRYAPSLANSFAVAKPIPSVAPVMTATFPCSFLSSAIDVSPSLECSHSSPIQNWIRDLVSHRSKRTGCEGLVRDHPSINRQGCPDDVGSLVRANEHDGIGNFFGRADTLVRNLRVEEICLVFLRLRKVVEHSCFH